MRKATIEDIKVGAKLKRVISENNINNLDLEVRAIVDDSYVVYRVFSEEKKRFVYEIDHLLSFEGWIKNNWLYLIS